MTSADHILIDPTGDELERALRGAIDAVNHHQAGHGPLLEIGGSAALAQAMWARPEGAREWRVPGHGQFGVQAALVAIWWTDFLGRRHLRLLGGCRHRGMELPAPLPSPHRPPLACVYPGACVIVTRHRRSRLLVVCECGAWGEPDRLAWMGRHCGPCFDRGSTELLRSPAVLPAGGSVHGVAFAPEGTRLAVWDGFGEVALWDLEAGRRTGSCPGAVPPPGKLAFGPDGLHLAWWGPRTRELRLARAPAGPSQARRASAFTFTPAPIHLISASATGIDRFDLTSPEQSGNSLFSFPSPFPLPVLDLAISPDGQVLAAACGALGLCLWDAHSGEPLLRAEEPACTGPLAWSPDGTALACGVSARFWKAILWDALGRQRRFVIGGTAPLHALAFSPDGQWLVTAEEDAIRTWHTGTGQERRALSLPGGERALSLAFSPDGLSVALGMSSGRVRLWPAEMLVAKKGARMDAD